MAFRQHPTLEVESLVTHVPSELYFKSPPPLKRVKTTDELELIKFADEGINELVERRILKPNPKGAETYNPLFACLVASLQPINPALGSPSWSHYIPALAEGGLSIAQLSIADTDSQLHANALETDDEREGITAAAFRPLWHGDTTNLSLVIPSVHCLSWSPCMTSDKMYVRVSYITAAEIIFAYYLDRRHHRHIVLNGTPGTGKTMFANVFFWRLLQLSFTDPRRLASSNPKHPVLIYRLPSGQGVIYVGTEFYQVPAQQLQDLVQLDELLPVIEASGERAWLITDTVPILTDQNSEYLNHIYIASTGVSNSESNKAFISNAHVGLITRIWSRGEIEELFNLSYSDGAVVTHNKLNRLFNICGGIPRSLFDNADDFNVDDSDQIILSPVLSNKLRRANWNKIFSTITGPDVEFSSEVDDTIVSSMIFHLHPHPIPRERYGRPLKQTSTIKWCSPWMAFEAVKRLKSVGEKKSVLFLLSGETDYRTAALTGHVFEGICHSILTRSSESLRCRLKMLTPVEDLIAESQNKVDLITYLKRHGFTNVTQILKPATIRPPVHQPAVPPRPPNRIRTAVHRVTRFRARQQQAPATPLPQYMDDEMIVQFPPLSLKLFHNSSDIHSSTAGSDTLWVPFQKNYEGIDAVVPDHALLFQMSKQASHSVSIKNVNDFLQKGIFPRAAMEGSLLVFMVPKERFDKYRTIQTLTHLGNQSQASVDIWLHQAVIEVDLEKEYHVM